MDDQKTIEANITIHSTYEDMIWIEVQDKSSGTKFLKIEMTREQFINATMNQLGNTNVKEATVRHLDRVGKTMKMDTLEFPIHTPSVKTEARYYVKARCPPGWIPDMGFDTQDSFFTKDGVPMARTTIRTWV